MELILINESKLKIMLSSEEMKEYNLDSDTVDYVNAETRLAIRNFLKKVKVKTGFDETNERIFIQFYTSKIGGCGMYVTKLNLEKEAVHMQQLSDSTVKTGEYSLSPLFIRRIVYSFSDLGMLIDVCRRLQLSGYSDHSEVYCQTEDKKEYLLVLDTKNENNYRADIPDGMAFINEYGAEKDYKMIGVGLCEHSRCLARENAVNIFSML